jgi:glycosyltransferase involved in cell wall biosynthesis
MKICLLTTRLNSVWLSMQEIIPAIEQRWRDFAKAEGHQIDQCIVDEDPCLKKNFSQIITADLIIIVAFNHKIAASMKVIRQIAGLNTPFVFYLHGQSSLGLWPLDELDVLSLLHTGDQFISTSHNDKACFDLLFENKKALIIPFQYSTSNLEDKSMKLWKKEQDTIDLVFVGRVSQQKNLHSLIYSLSLIKNKKMKLHLIGGEDHLSSPNMELEPIAYLEYLKSLALSLGVGDRVVFHGFQKRELIHSFLSQLPYVFVSPSLHSDENFGMAALWSLCHGARALLSNWGGHTDFQEHFGQNVQLIPVSLGDRGPYIEINHLTEALESIASDQSFIGETSCPEYYTDIFAHHKYKKILMERVETQPLNQTSLLRDVLAQRQKFKEKYQTKVFHSYEDPLAHSFFKAYGASEKNCLNERRLKLLPWARKTSSGYKVLDPHRGEFNFEDESIYFSEFAHF